MAHKCTVEGCRKAREELTQAGYTEKQLGRMNGWEIVHEANKKPRDKRCANVRLQH